MNDFTGTIVRKSQVLKCWDEAFGKTFNDSEPDDHELNKLIATAESWVSGLKLKDSRIATLPPFQCTRDSDRLIGHLRVSRHEGKWRLFYSRAWEWEGDDSTNLTWLLLTDQSTGLKNRVLKHLHLLIHECERCVAV